MPKEDGGRVTITVDKTAHTICCAIDDDGIGREVSRQSKFKGESSSHQSKGVHLTHARLDLDNLLNERNAKVKITDKKTALGQPAGTTVVVSFAVRIVTPANQ